MAQEYISQVSEEIEGRVTEKLSKEFSRTESRVLAALSKLDEFLLNPQVRTCSVAVPGTSRNNNSENREPTRDRSLGDPRPEAVFSACHTSHLNDSEQEETQPSPHYHLPTLSITKDLEKISFSTMRCQYLNLTYITVSRFVWAVILADKISFSLFKFFFHIEHSCIILTNFNAVAGFFFICVTLQKSTFFTLKYYCTSRFTETTKSKLTCKLE